MAYRIYEVLKTLIQLIAMSLGLMVGGIMILLCCPYLMFCPEIFQEREHDFPTL